MTKVYWLACLFIVGTIFITSAKGTCYKAPPALKAPNLELIDGLWYLWATTKPFVNERGNYKCNRAFNVWNAENQTLEVSCFNYNYNNGPESLGWVGNVFKNAKGEYENTFTNTGGRTLPYWEFFYDTYQTIQIDYGCPQQNGVPTEIPFIWIQSKTCKFNETIYQQALKQLADIPGIKNIQLYRTGSDECCP